jgi:hypothetical protein
MSDDPPYRVTPTLFSHIIWVQTQLAAHRGACTTRPSHECHLHDATVYQGQFDTVQLGCAACDVHLVLFKKGE